MPISLKDFVNIDELQELMQFCYEAVGVPLRVLDAKQEWLVNKGRQPICTDFAYSDPASEEICLQDSGHDLENLAAAEYLQLTCPHGLEKLAFPIRLRKTRLGTFFLGQFLYEAPDIDSFRRRAVANGFDQSAYLQALEKVPVVPQERIDLMMQFFIRFLGLMVRSGDENLRRKNAEKKVRKAKQQLETKVEERTRELNHALTEVGDLAVQMNSLLRQVEHMAITDTLTETFNRRKFDEVAELEQQRALNEKLPFSVILLDIDRFKKVNDRYGHSVGDQVLKQLCDVLRALIRHGDMLIRWGGEEFLIVLPATQIVEAGPLAERIRQAVKGEQFGQVGQLTVSLGVAQLRTEDSIDRLIQRVDRAMYLAKEKGRDRVVVEGELE
jgi:diguanylate cyclase (GGDEF)-like protein